MRALLVFAVVLLLVAVFFAAGAFFVAVLVDAFLATGAFLAAGAFFAAVLGLAVVVFAVVLAFAAAGLSPAFVGAASFTGPDAPVEGTLSALIGSDLGVRESDASQWTTRSQRASGSRAHTFRAHKHASLRAPLQRLVELGSECRIGHAAEVVVCQNVFLERLTAAITSRQ